MRTKDNVIGEVYGELKIVDDAENEIIKVSYRKCGYAVKRQVVCKCLICGAIGKVRLSSLRYGNTSSCQMFHNRTEMIGDTVKIFFHDGGYGLIDAEDHDIISGMRVVHEKKNHGYVRLMINSKKIMLHVLIMKKHHGDISGLSVDHINHITSDNRKCNLRLVTHANNMKNLSIRKAKKTSKYKGVYFDKSNNKFASKISSNNKEYWLGYFVNEIDAAFAYDKAALKHHGEYALTNKMLGLL